MKKVLSMLVIIVLLISVSGMTAFASNGRGNGNGNGNGGGNSNSGSNGVSVRIEQPNVQPQRSFQQQQLTRQTRFEVCTVADCVVVGPHQHGDTWYCSQSYLRDGHGLCPIQGCAIRGIHEHDGVYYHCAYYGTGLHCGAGSRLGSGNGIRLRDGSCRIR